MYNLHFALKTNRKVVLHYSSQQLDVSWSLELAMVGFPLSRRLRIDQLSPFIAARSRQTDCLVTRWTAVDPSYGTAFARYGVGFLLGRAWAVSVSGRLTAADRRHSTVTPHSLTLRERLTTQPTVSYTGGHGLTIRILSTDQPRHIADDCPLSSSTGCLSSTRTAAIVAD